MLTDDVYWRESTCGGGIAKALERLGRRHGEGKRAPPQGRVDLQPDLGRRWCPTRGTRAAHGLGGRLGALSLTQDFK